MSVPESIPLAAIVALNYFDAFASRMVFDSMKVMALEDNLLFYKDDKNLYVLKILAPTQKQYCLSNPTEIYSSSFSPDGSRLASCASDGYINVWNAYTNRVEQRFKNNPGGYKFCCWWSENFLFVIGGFGKILRLTRYPVDDNLVILFTHSQHKSLSDLVPWFYQADFDFGFVCIDCGKNEPVKVLDVRCVDGPVMIKLSGIEPQMRMEISPGGAFISGCKYDNCYLWKRNAEEPSSYEVIYHDDSRFYRYRIFSFSNDCKVAVLFNGDTKYCHVIDLDTGVSQVVHFESLDYSVHSMCIIKKRILITVFRGMITFFDLDSGTILDCSFHRYMDDVYGKRTFKLSPKEDILAFPVFKGNMVFLRLSIPPNPVLADIKREAVLKSSALKR